MTPPRPPRRPGARAKASGPSGTRRLRTASEPGPPATRHRARASASPRRATVRKSTCRARRASWSCATAQRAGADEVTAPPSTSNATPRRTVPSPAAAPPTSRLPAAPSPACFRNARRAVARALSALMALADPGHAPFGREAGELQRVVAGDHALARAGQLDHPRLGRDVARPIGLAERRAGGPRLEVPVQVAVVRGEDEGGRALHPEVLGRVRVPRARVGADPGKELDVVAVDQVQPSLGVGLQQRQHVVRIDADPAAARLPGLA